jgi:hypothetical protein
MATQRKHDADVEPVSGTVTGYEPGINDDFMRKLGTVSGNAFDDALAIATAMGAEVKSFATEMGTGFAVLSQMGKANLVGVKCLFLKWKFSEGDYGDEYVNVAVLTPDGGKYILNDGSTGICKQLREYTDRTASSTYMLADKGLRESSYATCAGKDCNKPRDARDEECEYCGDATAKRGTATTYYIDLAAPA